MLISVRKYLQNIVSRHGPFTDPDWEPSAATLDALASMKVL